MLARTIITFLGSAAALRININGKGGSKMAETQDEVATAVATEPEAPETETPPAAANGGEEADEAVPDPTEFGTFDLNGDGTIDAFEFAKGQETLNQAAQNAATEEMVEASGWFTNPCTKIGDVLEPVGQAFDSLPCHPCGERSEIETQAEQSLIDALERIQALESGDKDDDDKSSQGGDTNIEIALVNLDVPVSCCSCNFFTRIAARVEALKNGLF